MIFIDKSRFNLYLYRKQGRALRRQDAYTKVLDSQSKNISIIYTISINRVIKFDYNFRNITSKIFIEQMRELLTIFTNSSKKYFILDNFKIHYFYKLKKLFTYNIHEIIYFLLYSSQLNLINLLFSKQKVSIKNINYKIKKF